MFSIGKGLEKCFCRILHRGALDRRYHDNFLGASGENKAQQEKA